MAARVRSRTSDLYEQDFYAWAREQATLLRAGRFEELDLAHLTDEVEDLGGSLYRSVRSRIRTIIEHLLKLEHSPAAAPHGLWLDTIHTQRADLEDDLTASLRRRLRSELPKQYVRARTAAARALHRYSDGAAADALPRPAPTPSTRSPATGCRKAEPSSAREMLHEPVAGGAAEIGDVGIGSFAPRQAGKPRIPSA